MERIQKSTSSDNSQGYFHVTLPVSRDIILLDNTLWRQGLSATMHHHERKTLDETSLLSSESEIQHDNRSTSTPYGSHRPGYRAQHLKVCEKSVGVTCEQSNLSIAHVIYPMIQWHKLFQTTKVVDTHIHTKRQQHGKCYIPIRTKQRIKEKREHKQRKSHNKKCTLVKWLNSLTSPQWSRHLSQPTS